MKLHTNSSVPHIHPAAEWRKAAPSGDSLILYTSPDRVVEVGIRCWRPSSFAYSCERDVLCYFQHGRGEFRRDTGETIPVGEQTLIHFKAGWAGTLEAADFLESTYMTCGGASSSQTPVLRGVLTAEALTDWGVIPTMIEGSSRTAGILLSRDPDRRAESGIWTCTPGIWQCEVTSDEYCHFLAGSCTYTHESGETIEIEPDTLAFFPHSWKGRCEVRRTIRKVYLIG